MCCDTKQKIAQVLRQMMRERPLNKITVQELMERAQMKRQSFYYHFQDIYGVLGWICERQLGAPLREDPELDLEAWCLRLIGALEADRAFYRQALLAGDPEMVRAFCEGLVRPRMSRMLFQADDPRELSREQAFTVGACTRALTGALMELCASRRELDWDEARSCLHSLLAVLRPAEELCLSARAG